MGKTVRMNLAGMNNITRMEVPNITREAQNLEILIGHSDGWMDGWMEYLRICLGMLK